MCEGVTGRSVLDLSGELSRTAMFRKVCLEEPCGANGVFLTTSARVMPASRGDGRIMGKDWAGPISTRIPEAFWAKRAGGGRATPVDYDAHS